MADLLYEQYYIYTPKQSKESVEFLETEKWNMFKRQHTRDEEFYF